MAKPTISRIPTVVLFLLALFSCALTGCAAEREAAAWKPLFDGKTSAGWRQFGKSEFPNHGWVVEDGCLHLLPHPEQLALVTTNTFTDFELEWEWRIAAKANNGLKYFVTETRAETPGHEYQMVDEVAERGPKHATAAFYDVIAPQTTPHPKKPGSGEWNSSRVIVNGNHVEHWLNGEKVLTYELDSPELKAALAASKFRDIPEFGRKIRGPIMLTDHHGETWYRNIRIRELPAAQ